ncbi:hypothetical protein JMJ35_001062 [Cladonia borealis]|uniref:Uncharacterized protein n=1 Tax=Cladonia borealis TaxID=184061 RepID=A0AA39RA64_9LECA|nr:hypothetical protein JMJ35_001062 [Cladonia borealis]
MTQEGSQNPYTPTERADVDRRGGSVRLLAANGPSPHGINPNQSMQRARKWADGKTLTKQNAQGIFEFQVTVASARYDNTNHKWLYKLLDYKQQPIAGETPEVELG